MTENNRPVEEGQDDAPPRPSLIARIKAWWAIQQARREARPRPSLRRRTPTILQIEAVECGAASLGMVLGRYGKHVPLEELRVACGVSRDGAKASHIVKAARGYGLEARGYRMDPSDLSTLNLPLIAHWNLFHFVVIEGFGFGGVRLNDPASGPRRVSYEEFNESFTGVVLEFKPGEEFARGGKRRSLIRGLARRVGHSYLALVYVVLAGLALIIPGFIIPTFARVFVDSVLVNQRDILLPLLAGLAVTALLRGALTWFQQAYLLRLETKQAIVQSSKFLWHVLSLPLSFFHQRFSGEISSRVQVADKVATLLSEQLATTALNVILVAFYALLMWQYSPQLTVIGVLIASVNMLGLWLVSRSRSDTNRKLLQERGKLMGTTFNGLQIIETLKASGTESEFFTRWAGFQAKTVNAEQQMGVLTQAMNAVPGVLSTLNTTAILAFGGLQVIEGTLSVGELVAFQTLMVSFIQPFNEFVALGSTLQEIDGDMARVDDVYHYPAPNRVTFITETDRDARSKAKLEGRIELKGVTFGYSTLEPPLIADFNLLLRPGHRVALVGASGSGKSTLSKLVAGLYAPWAGEILFDGSPRNAHPRDVMTNSLSLVDQEIFLFEGSVRENLTLWDPTIEESDIVQAARDADIHDVLSSRPGGYDSHIAESGRNFSGGQRQRLEIARALVTGPTILVLDEATSALDPMTELIIDENLRRRGCTCLIVAHRLSTIRDCDEIIVLDHGQVVQRGTHDVMIAEDGPYSQLLMAEGYKKQTVTTKQHLLNLLSLDDEE